MDGHNGWNLIIHESGGWLQSAGPFPNFNPQGSYTYFEGCVRKTWRLEKWSFCSLDVISHGAFCKFNHDIYKSNTAPSMSIGLSATSSSSNHLCMGLCGHMIPQNPNVPMCPLNMFILKVYMGIPVYPMVRHHVTYCWWHILFDPHDRCLQVLRYINTSLPLCL